MELKNFSKRITSTVSKIHAKGKSNVQVTMDNGDVLGINRSAVDFHEGDIVSYYIAVLEVGEGDNKNIVHRMAYPENASMRWGKEKNLVFIDIKSSPEYDKLEDDFFTYPFWKLKSQETTKAKIIKDYENSAGLYPSFSKIVCVSLGYYNDKKFEIKSFYGEEKSILSNLIVWLDSNLNKRKLAGHLIKDFDLNFLYTRIKANEYPVPDCINFVGKKPWDIEDMVLDIDTLWRGGSRWSESLPNIAYALNIPYGDIDDKGTLTRKYLKKGEIEKVVELCERDVEIAYEIYLKLS